MLSFGNSPGALFSILGKVGLVIKQMGSYQASQQTNLISTTTGLVAQLNAMSDVQALVGSSYVSVLNSASIAGSVVQSVAAQALNRLIFLDNPLPNQTLQSGNNLANLVELIRQMKLAGATVLSMTITATPGNFTGTGNGVIVASTKRPFDGLVLENSFAEGIRFICTTDSYSGSAQAGSETFSVLGVGAEPSVFAYDWPLGSGASTSLSAINTNSNLLSNANFDNWTANVPDNWTLDVGVAGTNILQNSSLPYDPVPNSAMQLVGDAPGTLTRIRQAVSLQPLTQYAFNAFIRRDGVAAGSGVLTIELTDGSGAVINDANGVPNSFTVNLTTLSTVYTAFNTAFRTPFSLPSTILLRIRLSTALTNGRSIYFDHSALQGMSQLSVSGPFVSVFSGSVPFEIGDYGVLTITNSRGVGGTLNTFQVLAYRLFSEMGSSGLLLPSSSSPTLVDAAFIA